jgi:hypothetical protein
MTTAGVFLNALFGSRSDDALGIVLCTRAEEFRGRFFTDLEAAASFAESQAPHTDVYVGMGMRRTAPKNAKGEPGGRGDAATVEAIPGFWADIDVAGPAHKKPNLPPTLEAATEFLERGLFPTHPPSLIVHSGNGLQGYWLFPEPWTFDTPEEHKRASVISHRFSETIKEAAKAKGWAVDSVFDLARVLRIPGTLNHKSDPPRPVTMTALRPLRFSGDDVEGLLVAEELIATPTGGSKVVERVGFLRLDCERHPPQDKMLALLANDDLAKATWDHKRPDLKDQSPSGYDMSLALILANQGWTDQEVADALIARRRKQGDDLKTLKNGAIRQDYYQRTIAIAKGKVSRTRVVEEIASNTTGSPIAAAEVTAEQREAILYRTGAIIGHPISHWIQYGRGENALYVLVLQTGQQVPIGNAMTLENQRAFRAKLYPHTRSLFEPLKAGTWNKAITDLGLILEIEENPESPREAQFGATLADYLHAVLRHKGDEWKKALRTGLPFQRDTAAGSDIGINRANLENWISRHTPQRVNTEDLWLMMRAAGFSNEKLTARVAGKAVGKNYWVGTLEAVQRLGAMPVEADLPPPTQDDMAPEDVDEEGMPTTAARKAPRRERSPGSESPAGTLQEAASGTTEQDHAGLDGIPI